LAGPSLDSLDVEGPVQAEVFLLWLDHGEPALTGPCGADPWYVEVADHEDPLTVVSSTVERVVGAPTVVHSTSWRRAREAVVLSFIAVIDPRLVADLPSVRVARIELARNTATAAPTQILTAQVVEHGLRHLAWLVRDDPVVAAALGGGWAQLLDRYVPEPFRHLYWSGLRHVTNGPDVSTTPRRETR
jgi:hypothetical protein